MSLSYRLLLRWERRRLAISEWWWKVRCEHGRCPGCNVCNPELRRTR